MAPFKWSLIVLLSGLLLLGLPNGVKLEAPTEETKTSSVKECKVHIEKALEQYWEQEKPDKLSSPLDQTQHHINSESAEDSNDDDNESPDESQIQNLNESENQEDEEDRENSVNHSETDSDDDDDDEDIDDNENEDDDTESETQANENINHEEEKQDKVEDVSVSETPENYYGEEETDDDQGADETNDVEIFDNKTWTDQEETEKSVGEVQGEEVDEDDEDEDEEDEEEEDEENVSEQKADESTLESEGEEEYKEKSTTEGTESTTEEKIEESVSEGVKETESDKVTGEADSASAGVVSELPQGQPSVEQPETSKVPEETIPVTTAAPELNETTENREEDQLPKTVPEDKDDDTIENIYEEDDDDESSSILTFRSRDHIDAILGLDEIGTEYEKEEDKLAQSIFKDIKKIQLTNIRPMEMLYKYTDSTTRVLGDAEIFNKPMLLFLGPWNSGKTSIINYLLGTERTPAALKTGTGITDVDFTLVTYGDQKQVISGTELATDWRYAGVQKFGQGFLDHFRSIQLPNTLLKKVTLVDTPGILENKKNSERGYSLSDAFQWFIDRADAIYVVLDPTKVDIGGELGSVVDQLKGRDVRFILNKADTIRRSDLMRVVGQLFWNLSPLMSSTEAPIIYAVSLTTKPYHPSAPARFLADQENNFLYDMKDTLDRRVENRILYARRHAVRVRNHAKMVDCYLATYYRHKSIFSNKKNVAKLITENPRDYSIFDGIGSMSNISRYDLPDPSAYTQFFKLHPLYDFKPLASTCSYFRGCPMDKLDEAIARDIPELFAKYKKAKSSSNAVKQEGR